MTSVNYLVDCFLSYLFTSLQMKYKSSEQPHISKQSIFISRISLVMCYTYCRTLPVFLAGFALAGYMGSLLPNSILTHLSVLS